MQVLPHIQEIETNIFSKRKYLGYQLNIFWKQNCILLKSRFLDDNVMYKSALQLRASQIRRHNCQWKGRSIIVIKVCIVLQCYGVSQNKVGKLRCLCNLFQYRVGRTGETFKKEHASTEMIFHWMTPTNWNENNFSSNWLLYNDNWAAAKVLRTLPHPASHTF